MRIHPVHRWDLPPKAAIRLQDHLRRRVVKIPSFSFQQIRCVAGADLAFSADGKEAIAGVIAYSFPGLEMLEYQSARRRVRYPYIPGLLSFREGPALLAALSKIQQEPDVIFFDGHGIAHPRGYGIASDMGLILGKPTIGCAKSRLFGDYQEPGPHPGDWFPLKHERKTIGAILRTREQSKPIFISIGHQVDLKTAIRLTLACVDGQRIPKPTREADAYVARLKSDHVLYAFA